MNPRLIYVNIIGQRIRISNRTCYSQWKFLPEEEKSDFEMVDAAFDNEFSLSAKNFLSKNKLVLLHLLCISLMRFAMLHLSLLLLLLEPALAVDTLGVNQSIHDSDFIVSDDQNFKLGFFTPVNGTGDHRYVGVMYNSIPVLTVVWVANRDSPLHDSNGTLLMSENGSLVILDGQRSVVWSSHLSVPRPNPTLARILNTGNLVLLEDSSSGSTMLWESFHHPSDSYMQTMRLTTDLTTNETNLLTSWKHPNNPAPGIFTASVEPLSLPEIVVWKDRTPHWRSGPWNGQVFIGIPNMETYFYQNGFQVVNDNPESARLVFTYFNTSVLAYFVLNASGSLQQKVWSGAGWEVTWSSVVSECDVYGKCGPFGSCNGRAVPICACLEGYEPKSVGEWNAGNWSGGCVRRTPFGCEGNYTVGIRDGFFRVKRMKLPDRVSWFPAEEADCRSGCLSNCLCVAYAYYDGIGCMVWTERLVDVQKFSGGGGGVLYIRVAHTELDKKRNRQAMIATITVVLGFVTITACAYILLRRYRESKRKRQMLTDPGYSEERLLMDYVNGVKLQELPLFKLETLSKATQNFDSVYKLGEGGFGPVYKGELPNGQEIAVKRLLRSSDQGLEEFKNEVEVISKLQHRNLVRLLGCCVEREEKMLVYEYMANGSLDTYLFDSCKQEFLGWKRRTSIIEGICRGLVYLHRDSRLRIIHRDLKASNILLDKEMNPKISDFGTARIFGVREDQANTKRIVGTFGYMAPEYALQGRFSERSDVYSFGVVLLEIVSGRRNGSFYNDEEARSLVAFAWKLWNEDKMMNLVEPLICDPQMKAEIVRYAHVGLLCVQEIAQDRPNISTVLSMLSSEIVSLPLPKRPAFILHRRSPETKHSKGSRSKFSANDVTLSIVEGR